MLRPGTLVKCFKKRKSNKNVKTPKSNKNVKMIKPKTADLQIEATRFHGLVDTYNNDFANGGKIACFQVLFLSFPCLRFRKQFISQVFFFHVSNPYNCFICKSHFIHFISFLFFGTIFDVEAITSDLSPIPIFFYLCGT